MNIEKKISKIEEDLRLLKEQITDEKVSKALRKVQSLIRDAEKANFKIIGIELSDNLYSLIDYNFMCGKRFGIINTPFLSVSKLFGYNVKVNPATYDSVSLEVTSND